MAVTPPVFNGSGVSPEGVNQSVILSTPIPAGHFAVVDIVFHTGGAPVPSGITVTAGDSGSTQLDLVFAPISGAVSIHRWSGTVAGSAPDVDINVGSSRTPYVALVYSFPAGTTAASGDPSVNSGSSSPANANGTIPDGNVGIATIGIDDQGGATGGSMTSLGSVVSSPTGPGFSGRVFYHEGDGGSAGANVGFGGTHGWQSLLNSFIVPAQPVELQVVPGELTTEGLPMALQTFPPVTLAIPPGELTTVGAPMSITTEGAILHLPAVVMQSRSHVEDSLLFPADLTCHIESMSEMVSELEAVSDLSVEMVSRSMVEDSLLFPADLTCHIRSVSKLLASLPSTDHVAESVIKSNSSVYAALADPNPAILDVDPPSESFVLVELPQPVWLPATEMVGSRSFADADVPQTAPLPPTPHPVPPEKDCSLFRFPIQTENTQVKIIIRNPYPTYSDLVGVDWEGLWTRIKRKV